MSSVCITDSPSLISASFGRWLERDTTRDGVREGFLPGRRRLAVAELPGREPRTLEHCGRDRPNRSSMRNGGSRQLLADEVVVEALVRHQLLVGAVLDESSLLEHQD